MSIISDINIINPICLLKFISHWRLLWQVMIRYFVYDRGTIPSWKRLLLNWMLPIASLHLLLGIRKDRISSVLFFYIKWWSRKGPRLHVYKCKVLVLKLIFFIRALLEKSSIRSHPLKWGPLQKGIYCLHILCTLSDESSIRVLFFCRMIFY